MVGLNHTDLASTSNARRAGRSVSSGPVVRWAVEGTVLDIVERQVAACPERPAITDGATTLSYLEADRTANGLAHRLVESGVGAGDVVALAIDGGPELAVAVLAAMKVAAPFVILDPTPNDRRSTVLAELSAALVLCTSAGPAVVAPNTSTFSLADIDSRDSITPTSRAGLDDIAYGYFTSGSTGMPKCALNLHRGLRNRLLHMNRCFGVRDDDVVVQSTSPIYDSYLWQLLWPLINGNRFVVPGNAGAHDVRRLAASMAEHGATVADFVPSVLGLFIELLAAEPALRDGLDRLRALLVGGEAFNPEHVTLLRQLLPNVELVNTYGATENSIGSIFHHIGPLDDREVPIGTPISNTCAVVVDDETRIVAPGALGELYVGGDCLGAGYLGDLERTAEVFVDNPFADVATDRLYRTGDLVFMRDNGALVYVGRRDDQVQVQGVRVEPREVEAALLAQPDVAEAKVIARREAHTTELTAFVVGHALDAHAVRSRARRQLPRTMVPRSIVVLDDLPLMVNGKIDVGELRRHAAREAENPVGEAPRTGPHDVVRRAWRYVLDADPDSDASSFFDAGGDSLSAQRLALALEQQLGRRISVGDIIESPTVAALTRLAAGDAEHAGSAHAAPAQPHLASDIVWSGPRRTGHAGAVLLTGATGFVGAHLLAELLERTPADVHCLVRAPSKGAAATRLARVLRYYRIVRPDLTERVVPVAGDLSSSHFGWDGDDYRRLAREVDVVVHAGAEVNRVLDYRWHREANVGGTTEVLRFASTERLKRVHFVSTVGVLRGRRAESGAARPSGADVRLLELPHDEPGGYRSGYAESKWMAERVAILAADRGIPTTVYRLGEVFPSSATGVPNRRSLIDLILRQTVRVGAVFPSALVTDYTTVDDVAAVIAAGVTSEAHGWYHLLQPDPVRFDDLTGAFADEFGLRSMSYRDFWSATRDMADRSPSVDVLRLLSALPPADSGVANDRIDVALGELLADGTARFSTQRTERLLAASELGWHHADPALFRRYARAARECAVT